MNRSLTLILTMLLLVGSMTMLVPQTSEAYTTDFSTNDGWTCIGDYSVSSGHLTITSSQREGFDYAYRAIDYGDGVREYDINVTFYASSFDSSYGRAHFEPTTEVLTSTWDALWRANQGIGVIFLGYTGSTTINVDGWVGGVHETLANEPFSVSTAYHVSYATHQAGNSSYYTSIRIWTSGYTWTAPDTVNVTYWYSSAPVAVKYASFGNHDTNTSYGSVTGYWDDYSDTGVDPIPSIELINSATNPLFTGHCSESSLLMDGAQMDCWFSSSDPMGSATYDHLWYSYSSNGLLDDFSTPIMVMENIRFPHVAQDPATGIYYLTASKTPNNDVYAWTSTNKIDWSPANGGSPVLTKSTSPSSIYYNIWNTGTVIVDGVMHMWIECGTQSSQSDVRLAYSNATVASLDFDANRTSAGVVDRGGNPFPYYVETYDAVILLYGKLLESTGKWQIHASTVNTTEDLTSSASYDESPFFVIGDPNQHNADPALVFTNDPSKTYDLVFQYFYNQPTDSVLHQMYGDYSEDEFYAALTGGEVEPPNYLLFTSSPVTVATNGTAYSYSATVNQAGAAWSIVSGPAWLTIDPLTGVVSGTPNATGAVNITIRATVDGTSVDQTYILVVSEGLISTGLMNGMIEMIVIAMLFMAIISIVGMVKVKNR